jgi:DNA-binding NtrC family response regulator
MANTSKSSFKLKLLYGEGDPEVLAKQSVTIEKAGHHVTQAAGRQQIQEALKQDAFDLVILGPTLTKNDRHHLPYMVKKSHEGTRVLVMHTDGEGHPSVDATLETGRSIEALLAKISSMYAHELAVR